MSYAVILYLSGKNSRCFLPIVVPVTGVVCLLSYGLSFHNWVYWTRGNLLASRVMYISASVRFCCVECRAGTSVFGRFAGLGGGPVRVSCPFGFVLACVCVIEQVGGWRVGTIFFLYFCLLWRVGTIEIVSGCCILISTSFSLLLIALAGGHAR